MPRFTWECFVVEGLDDGTGLPYNPKSRGRSSLSGVRLANVVPMIQLGVPLLLKASLMLR